MFLLTGRNINFELKGCVMNKIYRIVWNSQLCRLVVTSELGRAKIKGTGRKRIA
ncbi:hypothetical protein GE278_23145 (plasmid) [Enterobacteriaceae bacterium Kacie_13]|nr:hypothetical protein GE278_23145 [Enterobacteriaceae bacterium Kacie_13]